MLNKIKELKFDILAAIVAIVLAAAVIKQHHEQAERAKNGQVNRQ